MGMPWAIATGILIFSAAIAHAWKYWLTAAPLDEPVSVSEAFSLERPVDLHVSERYSLELRFDRRDASFEKLRTLVGGAYGQKIEVNGHLIDAGEPLGLPIPVEWSLKNASGSVVVSGRSDVLGSGGWSRAEVGRQLYRGDLDAGQYTFSASLPKGVVQFHGIRAHLRLSFEPKLAHSRLMGTYWIASLVILVAIPASIVTGLLALWAWLK
jgi:hypothetical protein